MNGWSRVECVIVGSSTADSQSLSVKNAHKTIITILKFENFSIAESVHASGKFLLCRLLWI